jgi:hypothetical protein
MKKLRLTIYILFFGFNISLFLFSIYVETFDNIFELGSLILPKIPYMKYGALIGLILVIVDFIMDKAEKKVLSMEVEKIKNELNAVKAQLFDSQQPAKTETTTASPEGKDDASEATSEG